MEEELMMFGMLIAFAAIIVCGSVAIEKIQGDNAKEQHRRKRKSRYYDDDDDDDDDEMNEQLKLEFDEFRAWKKEKKKFEKRLDKELLNMGRNDLIKKK